MRSLKLTLLATVLAVTASSLAMADALVAVKSETVNYEDLRLSSRVGVAVLYGRIRTARRSARARRSTQCRSLQRRNIARVSMRPWRKRLSP